MLTKLYVNNFKNLVDVTVHFGPFTCIAGANGSGKSNLFDAILFLSALTDRTLIEAAQSVRSDRKTTTDPASLFHSAGGRRADSMRFEAEMIVPRAAEDRLGQQAEASSTWLKYQLEIGYREDARESPRLRILEERLDYLKKRDGANKLYFDHTPAWQRSVLHGRRTSPYISTDEGAGHRIIKRHGDGHSGRPQVLRADTLPRTVLSEATADEASTAVVARSEMQSWRQFMLEPAAMRAPNDFIAPRRLGANGANLAATLYGLAHESSDDPERAYCQLANGIRELVPEIHSVYVDRDEKRSLLSLRVRMRDGGEFDARSLSDGTLRFLALTIYLMNKSESGLLCLEEPENGINPSRMNAMLNLLQEISTDTDTSVDEHNPMRQVIINTHSPKVVCSVPAESLLMAELYERHEKGQRAKCVRFRPLLKTWRSRIPDADARPFPMGMLLDYLEQSVSADADGLPVDDLDNALHDRRDKVPVQRHPDVQQLMMDLRLQ